MKKMMKYILLIGVVAVIASCGSKSNAVTESAGGESISFLSSDMMSEAIKLAEENDKLIFVDVSTSWCGYCKKMKKSTYTDGAVAKTFNENYISVAMDAEVGDGIAFAKKHGVKAYPTLVIIDTKGKEVKKNVGYLSPDELLRFVK